MLNVQSGAEGCGGVGGLITPPHFIHYVLHWVSVQHLIYAAERTAHFSGLLVSIIVKQPNTNPAPPPPENRESWEFNYDGILAADPAGLKQSSMGGPLF